MRSDALKDESARALDDAAFEDLARAPEDLRAQMDALEDAVWFKDRTRTYIHANRAMGLLARAEPSAVCGRTEEDLFPGQPSADDDGRVLGGGEPVREKVVVVRDAAGREQWLSTTRLPWRDGEGAIVGIIGLTRRIKDFGTGQRLLLLDRMLREVLLSIMAIGVRDLPLAEQMQRALRSIVSIPWLPLKARGAIFLADAAGGALRLTTHVGLAPELQKACAEIARGHCLCGRAYAQGSTLFCGHVDDRHEVRFPGMAPHGHYCVPIPCAGEAVGVLTLYVDEGHRASDSEETYLATLAHSLGMLVERDRAAKELRQARREQDVLNMLLGLSLQPLTLHEILDGVLDMLLSLPWLAIESAASVFVAEGDPPELVMKSQRGMPPELVEACGRVPFGSCLCGEAASGAVAVRESSSNARHLVRYPGMPPHGHLCVPIQSRGKVLGVLNTYVREGVARSGREDAFLTAVADALAGVIERRRAEDALERAANYDAVTGIPNRTLFFDRLERCIADARRYGHHAALLFIDLDGFKAANDTLGHAAGDRVLQETARRLAASVRDCDTVARFGGDEFTVILSRTGARPDIEIVCRRIVEAVARPVDVGERTAVIGASLGVAVFPDDGPDGDTLLRRADKAMYAAKNAGRGTWRFHEPATQE